MKKKKLLYKIGLVFFSIIIALFVAEVGIRLTLPSQKQFAMYKQGSNGNHVLKPNLKLRYNKKEFSHDVIINSDGFRNKQELINKNLILFVGDSYTFGAGVDEEEHYSNIFDKMLNWDGKRFNVYNAGVPGYSTVNEFLYIEDLIERNLDIKKIFLGIDISDFNENLLFPIYDIQDDRLVFSTKERRSVIAKSLNFLVAHSELVNFIYYRAVHASILKNYFASFLKLKYFSINLPDKNLQIFAKHKDEAVNKKLEVFLQYFAKIAELCRNRNIELYVYYIPTIQEVYGGIYKKTLDTYGYKKENYDLDFLNKYIRDICIQNSARFIDIKKGIMRFNNEKMYYLVDQHLNRHGNLIAGLSIYEGYKNDKK